MFSWLFPSSTKRKKQIFKSHYISCLTDAGVKDWDSSSSDDDENNKMMEYLMNLEQQYWQSTGGTAVNSLYVNKFWKARSFGSKDYSKEMKIADSI